MSSSPKEHDSLASLKREVRRMRAVFGVSIIAMALMLAIVLPSIIKNTVVRVNEDPASAGLLTKIIYTIRGDAVPTP